MCRSVFSSGLVSEWEGDPKHYKWVTMSQEAFPEGRPIGTQIRLEDLSVFHLAMELPSLIFHIWHDCPGFASDLL